MTWKRLESSTTGVDIEPALRAPVADPLWFLTRQWQVGELRGEDAGRPVTIDIETTAVPLVTARAGVPDDARGPVATLERGAPVEPLVEREQALDGPGRTGLSARIGLQLARMMLEEGVSRRLIRRLRRRYPLQPVAGDSPTERLLAHRAPDGLAIHAAFVSGQLSVPARLERVLTRWERQVASIAAPVATSLARDSWIEERQEYSFHLSTSSEDPDTHVSVVAGEYTGGRGDWFAYDLDPDPPDVEGSEVGGSRGPRRRADQVIASAIRYQGMPADRWWQIEDAEVHMGHLDAGPTDLPRALVGGFAATFGTDWYMAPIEARVGELVLVRSVTVLDSFGERHEIEPTAVLDYQREGEARAWRFMELTGDDGPSRGRAPLLLLAPTMATVGQGRPLERVHLARDEQANLGWAIERVVESRWGRRLDRQGQALSSRAGSEGEGATDESGDSGTGTGAWPFTIDAVVPEHWVPLIPVRLEGSGEPRLQRGRVPAPEGVGEAYGRPRGVLLVPDRRLMLHDDEVVRSGVEVTRRARMTRGGDGSLIAWVGRRKRLSHIPTEGRYLTDQLDESSG